MVDGAFMEQMKPGSVLINTSRGKVVNTEALIQALESSHLHGACLDVFENEKVQTYTAEERAMYQRLYSLENTVLTPHVAGWTRESLLRIAEVLLHKIHVWRSQKSD
jgi:D-3-phosphoglycerate dehydrogenase